MRMLERYPEFREKLPQNMVMVDITTATNWFYEENPQEIWDLHEHMHTLTPPGEITYMELEAPRFINSSGILNRNTLLRVMPRLCAIIACVEIDKESMKTAVRDYFLEKFFASVYKISIDRVIQLLSEGKDIVSEEKLTWATDRQKAMQDGMTPRFVLGASVYADIVPPFGGHQLFVLHQEMRYLDENGKAYPACDATVISPTTHDLSYAKAFNDGIPRLEMVFPFAFALSLMNCKNVELIDDQRHLDRATRRRMERNGQKQVVYKNLYIKQLQKRIDEDQERQKTGRKNRLHFVRAHWANYTADAPLFGKYTGTFFRPACVKGSASVGEVVKRYTVDAPQ